MATNDNRISISSIESGDVRSRPCAERKLITRPATVAKVSHWCEFLNSTSSTLTELELFLTTIEQQPPIRFYLGDRLRTDRFIDIDLDRYAIQVIACQVRYKLEGVPNETDIVNAPAGRFIRWILIVHNGYIFRSDPL